MEAGPLCCGLDRHSAHPGLHTAVLSDRLSKSRDRRIRQIHRLTGTRQRRVQVATCAKVGRPRAGKARVPILRSTGHPGRIGPMRYATIARMTDTAPDMPGHTHRRDKAVDATGEWFAKHRALTFVLTVLGGVAAAFSPLLWTNLAPEQAETVQFIFPNQAWWELFRLASIVLGVLAVLAVVGDKLADRWESKAASLTVAEGERAAEKSILDLNVVLNEAIRTVFLTGQRQSDAVEALRRTVVNQAAQAVGPGTRATSYCLRRENDDRRVLDEAEHGVWGRNDKPNKPFFERLDPDLDIWRMLDREDDEPEVRSYPEEIPGLDWESKKNRYKTFFSVPVKAQNVQLGMLSVNNRDVGAIGGPQRAVIIAMAKTLALATAVSNGAKIMNEQFEQQRDRDALHQMSDTSATVTATGKGADNERQ